MFARYSSIRFLVIGSIPLSFAFGTEYPAQKINRVDSVYFGQAQKEVERVLEKKAEPDDSGLGRPDKDFVLKIDPIKLEFDSGRLDCITFDDAYNFAAPIVVFPEAWRNPDPINDAQIKRGMKREDFLRYFQAWELRARQTGARRYEGNRLLREGEYSVSVTREEFIDTIHVSFGPERSTGKGGTWGSGLNVSFVTKQIAPIFHRPAESLDSISVSTDEFNTHARLREFDAPQAIEEAAAQPEGIRGSFTIAIRGTGRQNAWLYLNSEEDYRDPKCLTIAIQPNVAKQLEKELGNDPATSMKGTTISVAGTAQQTQIWLYFNGVKTDKYYYQTQVRVSSLSQLSRLPSP